MNKELYLNSRPGQARSTLAAGYALPFWWRLRKALGTTVVALKDFDGEITYRPARRTPFGLTCDRMGFGICPLVLNPDGTISPDCFVVRWCLA